LLHTCHIGHFEKQETSFGFIEINRLIYLQKLKHFCGFISNMDFDIVVKNDSIDFSKNNIGQNQFQ
jgi:hypothetical protein